MLSKSLTRLPKIQRRICSARKGCSPCRSHQAASSARDKSVIRGGLGNEPSDTGSGSRKREVGTRSSYFHFSGAADSLPPWMRPSRFGRTVFSDMGSTRQLTNLLHKRRKSLRIGWHRHSRSDASVSRSDKRSCLRHHLRQASCACGTRTTGSGCPCHPNICCIIA